MFTPSPSSVVLGSPWVMFEIAQGILGLALTLAWRSRSALAGSCSSPVHGLYRVPTPCCVVRLSSVPGLFFFTVLLYHFLPELSICFSRFFEQSGKNSLRPGGQPRRRSPDPWPRRGGYAAPPQAPVTPSTTAKNKRRKFTVDNIRKPCYNVPTGKGGAL